tara:strand:- start:10293 stop:10472 length:180 start_codon:yes stop_codon:yes gene_type:complete
VYHIFGNEIFKVAVPLFSVPTVYFNVMFFNEIKVWVKRVLVLPVSRFGADLLLFLGIFE